MKKLMFTAIVPFFLLFNQIHSSETLYKYNTSNGKYHKQTCRWAVKCTKNCIDMSLKEICDKKGIPCKVCKPPKCN